MLVQFFKKNPISVSRVHGQVSVSTILPWLAAIESSEGNSDSKKLRQTGSGFSLERPGVCRESIRISAAGPFF